MDEEGQKFFQRWHIIQAENKTYRLAPLPEKFNVGPMRR